MAIYAELNWTDDGAVNRILNGSISGTNPVFQTAKDGVSLSSNKFLIRTGGVSGDFSYRVPIIDNISVDYQTDFETLSDKFGGFVSSAADAFRSLGAAGGKLSKLSTYFDFQTWQRTQPIALNLELLFFMETDAFLDVVVPINSLSNLAILTKTKEGFTTPGINMTNFGKAVGAESDRSKPDGDTVSPTVGKFLDITIPGIIRIDNALVTAATPTWNTNTTRDGSAISGSLNLRIESLYPASDEFIADTLQTIINKRRTEIELGNQGVNAKEIILKQTPAGDILGVFS